MTDHAKDKLKLRPVIEADLAMFRRLVTEPGLVGPDWRGFRDAGEPARTFAQHGYLTPDEGRLMVDAGGDEAAGFVIWFNSAHGRSGWEIGICLLPEWRGKGLGWRAQSMLCDYLFAHWPRQRIEAFTQEDNIGEQKALVKAGFTLEGVLRAVGFREGQWRDGWLYSRLRGDPAPAVTYRET